VASNTFINAFQNEFSRISRQAYRVEVRELSCALHKGVGRDLAAIF